MPPRKTPLRSTGRVNPVSKKRRAQADQRTDVRRAVLAAAGHRCEAIDLVPEVRCGDLPGRTGLEVDELRGGSYRVTEWLDPAACQAVCPVHHDWKTAHKREYLHRREQAGR